MELNSNDKQIDNLQLTSDTTASTVENNQDSLEISLLPKKYVSTVGTDNSDRPPKVRTSSVVAQKSEQLLQTLKAHKHERQIIILQDFP
ncbi:MAG: bifunctional oligoribonuclease/PAP phosphatase NrnA, partial [Cyanobacteria bacterium J06635_10]